jgi:hypothetical protein
MDLTPVIALIPAQYGVYVTAAIGVAAIAATLLPPPKKPASGWYPAFYQVVNLLAANVGHAKNSTAPVGTITGSAQ